ncbi:unnamed protein product, partial [Gulo gulo]
RKAHPDKDWFHLVGLLHDLGKVLVLAGEPQVRAGVEGCHWDSWGSGLWKPARWAGQSHAGGCLSTVGGGWRHLPGRLPSPGLCGFLRFHLPGQPGSPGSPIQVLLPGCRPSSPPCSRALT